VRQQALQERQREGRGLAGTGLGAAHDVLAGHDQRNGFLLDRRRFGVTLFGNGAENFGRKAELVKTHRRHP